jgi:hypothetical protein
MAGAEPANGRKIRGAHENRAGTYHAKVGAPTLRQRRTDVYPRSRSRREHDARREIAEGGRDGAISQEQMQQTGEAPASLAGIA